MTGRWRVEKRQTIWGIMPIAWCVIGPIEQVVDFFSTHKQAIDYAQKRALNEAFRDHIFERLDIPIPRQEQS